LWIIANLATSQNWKKYINEGLGHPFFKGKKLPQKKKNPK
jgi:hypothetical protein